MMYKKLLVTLDGSRISEAVLPYARSLAKSLKIPVQLMQAVDPEDFRLLPEPVQGQYYETQAERTASGVAYLERVAVTFPDIAVKFCVELGNPAELILDKAAANSGTLIAMASHGRSGFQHWLLGSVAHKVASVASNPLLLVRANQEMKTDGEAELTSVLVPLDGSELAEMALPHARELAIELLIELIVLRVCDFSNYRRLPRVNQIARELKLEAKEYLEKKMRQLEAQGLEEVSYLILEGDPAVEIVDIAQKKPDNLVAITTHGRTGIKRWLLGSVTEHVIRHATGPILIIRAP